MSLWARTGPAPLAHRRQRRAVALFAAAGWIDHDGDGVRDQGRAPLHLTLIIPGHQSGAPASRPS